MKIGFDAKRFFHNNTGLGNYSRDLVRILSKHYPDNSYFLYNTKPNADRKALVESNNTIEKLPHSFLERKLKGLWRMLWVKKQIKQDGISVFHGLSGEIPVGLPKDLKSVVTIHDLIFIRYPNLYSFFDRKIHYWKFLYAAKNADCVIAISEQTKRDVVQYLKVEPEKVKVVYQGCSDVFKMTFSDEEKQVVSGKFDIPQNFILNVGTLEERKNALSILKAIKDIDTTLVLVGKKTAYYNELESYASQEGLQHKLIHLGGVSQRELAIVYQLATIMVYPSIFEGFGIPIIEALYSKTPVITTNSGVFPEAGGPNSVYIEPYDVAVIRDAIQMLMDTPELRREMAEEGYKFVQKFNDEVIASQLEAVYKAL